MRKWLLVPCLAAPVLALAADPAPAPLPADKAAKNMVLPDGFRATVFAAEPTVVQPISFCTDARGRLFVAEALNYGAWQPTGKDRVVILEDADGDGAADKRTLFYEGLNYVTGIEVGFGGVWVVSPPQLLFIPDRDGDDKPDGPPEVLFDGFGYKESRHNLVNGFTWGPDGWLYGGHGRTSPSDVGRPGTPADKRVHCDGGVYRIHPTRLVFENVADGTTNPWGVDFDDYGECFVSNCVNPHLFHMIPGGHYEPWRNRPSSRYAYERLPTIADHLHYPGGDIRATLGKADTLAMGGGHAHCGTLIYLGDSFPKEFRNTALMCNVHGRRVNHDVLKRKGSGYVASHGKDFMVSADPWFMGVTLRTGPDGSVFVSDWSDTGECHTYKPNKDTGRIYKISHGDAKGKPVDLAKLTDAELVKLQADKNDWHVRHARRLLQERAARPNWDPAPVREALRTTPAGADVPQRLRALWALHVTGGADAAGLLRLLDDPAEHVRAWAVRLLCEPGAPTDAVLAKFAGLAKADPSPVVRLHLASVLQRLPLEKRWDIATALSANAADATDANLPLMIWYGVEPLVPTDPARALTLAAGAGIPKVREFVARRVADEAVTKGDKADLGPLAAALAAAPDKVRLDFLAGAREGVKGRKSLPMPAGWDKVYADLGRSPDPDVRRHATALALLFGDPRAVVTLKATARDAAARAADRVAAVEALVGTGGPDLAALLHDLLADKAVRAAALRGLAAAPHPKTAERVLSVYPGLTADEKHAAVATLAARKDSALALLDAVEKGAVPRVDVSAFDARQVHALGDAKLSDRLRQVWGEVRETAADKQKRIADYKAVLRPDAVRNADAARGRVLFAKACGQCHKLFGEGGAVGPDLTGSNRSDLDYLLSNLIDPSAEVGRDYRLSVVRTTDERVLTGIVVDRSPARLVLQTATEKVTLAAEDVAAVKDSAASIMPEGQLDALTREQVRDLFAYLGSKVQVDPPPGAK
jgi:putative membrane-bound dehydrogenase-like protein